MKVLTIVALIFGFYSASVLSSVDIPKLDLRSIEGQSLDLDNYVGKGKWVLVMFWANDCHICEQQKPTISEFHNKHKNKDAIVLGVSIDGLDKIDAIRDNLEANPISFPTLVGDLGVISMNYQIKAQEQFRGTPTYWLFDRKGELVGVNPGPLRIKAIEEFIARKS